MSGPAADLLGAELLRFWAGKLRSGEYRQGTGALRAKTDGQDEFCCLGVLCDIIDPRGWKDEEVMTEADVLAIPYETKFEEKLLMGEGPADTYPPPSIWGRVHVDDSQMEILASRNDNGATFEHIAETLEEWASTLEYGEEVGV